MVLIKVLTIMALVVISIPPNSYAEKLKSKNTYVVSRKGAPISSKPHTWNGSPQSLRPKSSGNCLLYPYLDSNGKSKNVVYDA